MEQLVALGYIEKPGENIEEYVAKTVRELRFNLLEAYQDGNRHAEALEIARELCRQEPDDQRYALKRFLSCQALGLVTEMREIVDDMDGRRREMFPRGGWNGRKSFMPRKERYNARKIAAGETIDAEELEKELHLELSPHAETSKSAGEFSADARRAERTHRNLSETTLSPPDHGLAPGADPLRGETLRAGLGDPRASDRNAIRRDIHLASEGRSCAAWAAMPRPKSRSTRPSNAIPTVPRPISGCAA